MGKQMENKNQKIIQGILLSSLVIMFFEIIQPLQEANALNRVTVATGFNNVQFTKYVPGSGGTNYIFVGNFSSYIMKVYNANTSSLISTINVKSVTPTSYSLNNVSCDKSGGSQLCAVGFTNTVGNSGVFLVNVATGSISNNNTRYTNINPNLVPIVSLFNDGLLTHVVVQFDDGVSTTNIWTLAINTTGSLTTTSNRLVLISAIASNVRFTGAFNEDTATILSGANAGNWILYMNTGSVQLWSISQAKRTCGFNLPAGSVGDIDFVSDSSGTYFLVSNQISTLYTIDLACNNAIATNFSPSLTNIYSISHSASRKEVYLVGDTNKLLVVNETTLGSTLLASYGNIVSPGVHFNNLATTDAYYNAAVPKNPFVAIGGGGNPATLYFFYWNSVGTGGNGGTPGTTTCIDTTPFGPTATLTCYICPPPPGVNYVCPHGFPGGAGIPPFSLFYNGSQSVGVIGCATGWFSCSNQNILTNGAGFALLIVVLLFTTIVTLWATYKTGHEVAEVTFPIMLMCTLECGAFWQMNLTTSVPFFVAIIGVIGLGGFKIYSKVTGRE